MHYYLYINYSPLTLNKMRNFSGAMRFQFFSSLIVVLFDDKSATVVTAQDSGIEVESSGGKVSAKAVAEDRLLSGASSMHTVISTPKKAVFTLTHADGKATVTVSDSGVKTQYILDTETETETVTSAAPVATETKTETATVKSAPKPGKKTA